MSAIEVVIASTDPSAPKPDAKNNLFQNQSRRFISDPLLLNSCTLLQPIDRSNSRSKSNLKLLPRWSGVVRVSNADVSLTMNPQLRQLQTYVSVAYFITRPAVLAKSDTIYRKMQNATSSPKLLEISEARV